jgi:hypothetical protein
MLTTTHILRLLSIALITAGLLAQAGGWRALWRGLKTTPVADASHVPNRQGMPLDPNRPPWGAPAIWLGIFLGVFSFAWDIAEHFR